MFKRIKEQNRRKKSKSVATSDTIATLNRKNRKCKEKEKQFKKKENT